MFSTLAKPMSFIWNNWSRPFVNRLRRAFRDENYTHCHIAVAWCRTSGLDLLQDEILEFLDRGDTHLHIVVGIDGHGLRRITSREALQRLISYRVRSEDRVHISVFHIPERNDTIFHPKTYVFRGEQQGLLLTTSNNFTRRGMTRNIDSGFLIEGPVDDNPAIGQAIEFITHLEGTANRWSRSLEDMGTLRQLLRTRHPRHGTYGNIIPSEEDDGGGGGGDAELGPNPDIIEDPIPSHENIFESQVRPIGRHVSTELDIEPIEEEEEDHEEGQEEGHEEGHEDEEDGEDPPELLDYVAWGIELIPTSLYVPSIRVGGGGPTNTVRLPDRGDPPYDIGDWDEMTVEAIHQFFRYQLFPQSFWEEYETNYYNYAVRAEIDFQVTVPNRETQEITLRVTHADERGDDGTRVPRNMTLGWKTTQQAHGVLSPFQELLIEQIDGEYNILPGDYMLIEREGDEFRLTITREPPEAPAED